MTAIETLRSLPGFKGQPDRFTAKCPAHEDRENSLSVTLADGGKILVNCHAGCATPDVLAALDLKPVNLFPPKTEKPKRQFDCAYDYTDAAGKLVFQVVRWKPKSFTQRRPDPQKPGGWIWNLDGIERPLYHLHEVLSAIQTKRTIYLCEGEKDADALRYEGLCATTNAGGCAKWTKADAATLALAGADVVVLADNDAPGIAGAWKRADSLGGAPVLLLPGLPEKGDVSDWLAQGGTAEELERLTAEVKANPPKRPALPEKPKRATPTITADVDPLSELAMAHRLLNLTAGDLLHATDRGWLLWDGARFQHNEKSARRHAAFVGPVVRKEGQGTEDPDEIARYYRAAKKAESATGIEATLKVAASLHGIDADTIEFDADPWVLNCLNGIVNLRTGELLPHRREAYCTRLCPHKYDPRATCPRWLAFLDEVFESDRQIIDWIHWLCGYTSTGATHRHILPILHGSGRNGKSVFLKALRHVLGPDFAVAIDPEDLMAKGNAQHNHSLPRLRGARFVMAQETAEGRRLNEALIKTLTGDDPIVGRHLYGAAFEFMPTHTLWMASNYRPRIGGSAPAIWERVRLIPFNRQFARHEQDPNLDATLRDEAAGILAWCVEGARMAEPLIPERVRAATDEYRDESDVLGTFIDEVLTFEWEHARILKRDVYEAYKRDRNNHCEPLREFNKRLAARGFEEVKTKEGLGWKGVALRPKYAADAV